MLGVMLRPLLIAMLASGPVWAAGAVLTFEKDVRPILKANCFHCHGEEGETKGGLDVRLARFLQKGGESGPAIVPGDAAKSHLIELVKAGEMPKGKTKLKSGDIAILERWIASGAKTARPEPEKLGPEHAFTDEERAWWSLQPISPQARKSLDGFIEAKLTEKGLSFSREADPATFIRRASFDLLGLPPTPQEVEA
ncbi:MAG: DUF1549 domain-containing protein, partial [Verrucomicrobiaceae bacterium]|nr:DUF1549 domain-containing protein [Verrucomicrobiaceae bacterium]